MTVYNPGSVVKVLEMAVILWESDEMYHDIDVAASSADPHAVAAYTETSLCMSAVTHRSFVYAVTHQHVCGAVFCKILKTHQDQLPSANKTSFSFHNTS